MKIKEKTHLERAGFPEHLGVCSGAIKAYMDEAEAGGIETHSLMVLRHGKVAFEAWREPYGPDMPHTLYSVSKPIAATAVGFAIAEGLLSFDDKVIDFFPEHRPKKPDAYLEKLTVRHLLSMTSGKDISVTANKGGGKWQEQFFNAKWCFEPGTNWKYISENTYMLCVILHKVTAGMSVTDFLCPRLFEPLGFDRRPVWETDENGIEAGGWGLYLTTEEIVKIALCYLNEGRFGGKQVIPGEWAREAVKSQARRPSGEEVGYGYGFWLNLSRGFFSFDGMFSQYAFVFPEYDAIFAFTAMEIDQHKALECLWHIYPGLFIDEQEKPPEDASGGMSYAALPDMTALPRSPLEKEIEGKTIRFNKKKLLNLLGFPLSTLTLPATYMSANRAGNIDRVVFRFNEDSCEMGWREGPEQNSVLCGMDGRQRRSPMVLGNVKYTAAASAAWEDEKTLELWIRPLEAVGERRYRFRFQGKKVLMRPSSMPEIKSIADFLGRDLYDFCKNNKLLIRLAKFGLSLIPRILEPVHHGKMKGPDK
ncbi:MAG: beta-lactamase family protein [Oscillospiraceae bacterium]|nr:beta-lactamase family protein [Oscillospiraceae bacterium]